MNFFTLQSGNRVESTAITAYHSTNVMGNNIQSYLNVSTILLVLQYISISPTSKILTGRHWMAQDSGEGREVNLLKIAIKSYKE